jgi:hypothetical protein
VGNRGRFNKDGGGWVPPKREPVAPGSILGPGGNVVSTPGEFSFADGEPRVDETVYELFETVQPRPENAKVGETFGIQLPVPPGWMFCTMKVPGGTKDDVALVFLRGTAPPPKGTRFTFRMLRPADDPSLRRPDAEKDAEDQGGQGPQDAQGDEGVQVGVAQVGPERQEGDEPRAGDRDRAGRERAEPEEEKPSQETVDRSLGAALVGNPEADAMLRDYRDAPGDCWDAGLDEYGPDGL